MPIEWDGPTYAANYDIGCRNPTHPHYTFPPGSFRVGYGREFERHVGVLYDYRYAALTHWFSIAATDRILIAGCGFGYLIERFHDNGHPNVWGIDSSPWIAANRGTEARDSVLWVQDDLTGGGRVRAGLRQLTGDHTFDWIITEQVVGAFDDTEVGTLLSAAETVLAGADTKHIIHLVSVDNPAAGVPRTWDQLVALRPAHSWITGGSPEPEKWQVA